MSKVWDDFMNSDFARQVVAEMEKEGKTNKKAQENAFSVNTDRNQLYDVGWHENYLAPSETTEGVSGGGGSNVGSGERGPLYDNVQTAPVPGGAEAGADATVEGKEDIAKKMMDVATSDPSGNPQGTQDNNPENWEGLQAAGSDVKPFTKKAEEGFNLDELLSMLEGEADDEAEKEEGKDDEETLDSEEMMQMASNGNKTAAGFIEELVGIADSLDSEGKHEEAAEIDTVIRAEVQALKKKVHG